MKSETKRTQKTEQDTLDIELLKASIVENLNSFKKTKDPSTIDPFYLIAKSGLYVSMDEFENLIFNSDDKELIKKYSFYKDFWKRAMFNNDGYGNLRKDLAEKALNLFSSSEILNNVMIIVPTDTQIEKMLNDVLEERKIKRANEYKKLMAKRKEMEN